MLHTLRWDASPVHQLEFQNNNGTTAKANRVFNLEVQSSRVRRYCWPLWVAQTSRTFGYGSKVGLLSSKFVQSMQMEQAFTHCTTSDIETLANTTVEVTGKQIPPEDTFLYGESLRTQSLSFMGLRFTVSMNSRNPTSTEPNQKSHQKTWQSHRLQSISGIHNTATWRLQSGLL